MVEPMSDLAITLEEAREVLRQSAFIGWWGIEVVGLGSGTATVALPFRPELVRPGGVLHGSSYEVVADVGLWLAIMTLTGEEQMAVTIEMKTSFLRGATTDIAAHATVTKLGRRIAFGTADVFDAGGVLVAQSSLSYVRANT